MVRSSKLMYLLMIDLSMIAAKQDKQLNELTNVQNERDKQERILLETSEKGDDDNTVFWFVFTGFFALILLILGFFYKSSKVHRTQLEKQNEVIKSSLPTDLEKGIAQK